MDRKKTVLHRKRLDEYEKAVFGRESKFQTKNTAVQDVDGEIARIDGEIARLEKEIRRRQEGTADFRKQGNGTELDKDLADALIRKIIVYDEEHIEMEWILDTDENAFV